MDHVVYLDAKAREMENLLEGKKTMIIRGAAGRKMPYGRVSDGDVLYFINNNAEGVIKAKAHAKRVIQSAKMTKEESQEMVQKYQDKLQLTEQQFKRWAGKRYIVLIEVDLVEPVAPLPVDRDQYGSMDDWLPVGDIHRVSN